MNECQIFYIKKYLAANAKRVFLLPVILTVLLMAVYVFTDFFPLTLALAPLALGAAWYVLSLLSIIRFNMLISEQRRLLGVEFTREDAYPLHKGSLDYLSPDWFVRAGSFAVYRGHLIGITYKCTTHLGPRYIGYRAILTTADGRTYTLPFASTADIRALYEWRAADEAGKGQSLQNA